MQVRWRAVRKDIKLDDNINVARKIDRIHRLIQLGLHSVISAF